MKYSPAKLILPLLLLPSLAIADRPDVTRRPNIVVILADDMGYADVGMHGCADIPTPNIDALAKQGVRCTRAYVSGPYCSPTRAGLMTGRYQERFGHEFNPPASGGLPVGEVTIADRLKAAGYATGLVGKWHLGKMPQFHPQKRGFDEFFGFLDGDHAYFPATAGPKTGPEEHGGWIRRGAEAVGEQEYLTEAFAREAVAFIDRHAAQPFFLYLAFNAVHTPLQVPERYLSRVAGIEDRTRRIYAAMASAMDDAIGGVVAELRTRGLEEQTLIFFLNDNGGPVYPHYRPVDFSPEAFAAEGLKGTTVNGSSNAPLRGSKRQLLEGGIRVPFVVQWKGTLPAGKVYDDPVIQLDVLPTVLAAAGVGLRAHGELDGVDLRPYLDGSMSRAPHDVLFWRFGRQMAVIQRDWKLVRFDEKPAQLYDLGKDVGETHDLLGEAPDKAKELKAVWDRWAAGLARPLSVDKREM